MTRKPARPPTEEERALFADTLRDVTPHRARMIAADTKRKPAAAMPPSTVKPAPATFDLAPAPSIGGHREAHLRRGRIEPQARIDLHGMTQNQAHRALTRFLARARDDDHRIVLVITGKGGVLQDQVPRWLNESAMRAFIGGASPAHIRHGGAGALYVSLKRRGRK